MALPLNKEEENSRAGLMDSDSALFDDSDDIRLRTKSLVVVTDTRQGQSALVPGLTAVKTPSEEDLPVKPFTIHKVSPSVSLGHRQDKALPTATEAMRDDFPVQEVTLPHNSVRIYPSQSDSICRVGATEIDVESTPLLKNQRKINSEVISLKCWKITVPLFLVGIAALITTGSILFRISTVPGSIFQTIDIENKDMILLNFFDTFYYNEINVEKSKSNQCPDCSVEVYSFYPDNLIVDDNYFNISSDIVTATHDDVILPPTYFISGSKVRLSAIFFPTKGQNTTVKFVLFNNLPDYEAFQRGDKPGAYQTYHLQVNEKERTFSALITIANTDYYFIGLRPDSPVNLKFTVMVHQIYYSRANFPPPVCLLTSTEFSCTVQFMPSSTDAYTNTLNTCVLVYSIPPVEVAESYLVTLDYNVYRGFWNVYSLVLVSFVCLSVLCVVFVSSCWIVSCVWNVMKLRKTKYYVNINS